MSRIEREQQRRIDELVLRATGEELAKLQEMDVATQLSGGSFYDSYSDGPDVKLASRAGAPKKR